MHPRLIPAAAFGGLCWLSTLRLHWQSTDMAEGPGIPLLKPCVLILWHEHLPILARAFAHRDIAVLVSQSADGELATSVLEKMGYRVFRGSSSRGGFALRGLTRALQAGGMAGMALDGPRGPYHHPKPGAGRLAALGQASWVPVAVHAERSFRLGSWDRCLIPLPFSRIWLRLGSPMQENSLEAMATAMETNQATLMRLLDK